MKDISTSLVVLPSTDDGTNAPTPKYEVVPYDLDQALERHVGLPGASQRSLLPDIWYLWGPGRLLANQTLGFSGLVVALVVVLGVITWNFTTFTLQLLVGLLTGDPPRL